MVECQAAACPGCVLVIAIPAAIAGVVILAFSLREVWRIWRDT